MERKIAKTRPTMFLKRSPTNKLRVSHFIYLFGLGFGHVEDSREVRIKSSPPNCSLISLVGHRLCDIGIGRNIPMSRDLYSKILIEFASISSSSLELDTDKSVPFQALFHFDFVDRGKRAECF